MINVAHFRAAVEATNGEAILVPKPQLAILLVELEIGQNARRKLIELQSSIATAARTVETSA